MGSWDNLAPKFKGKLGAKFAPKEMLGIIKLMRYEINAEVAVEITANLAIINVIEAFHSF